MADIQGIVAALADLPPAIAYLIIGLGSAIENAFPPVPSDTFLVLGGVLTDRGRLDAWAVLGIAWFANVSGAMLIYWLARVRGQTFFQSTLGERLLRPHQLDRLTGFYGRYGLIAIFFSRFIPVLRVVVPTFAGIAGLGPIRTAIPVGLASAISSAILIYAGIFASRNLPLVFELLGQVNSWLLVVAGIALVGIAIWWYRTRDERKDARKERRKARDLGRKLAPDDDRDSSAS